VSASAPEATSDYSKGLWPNRADLLAPRGLLAAVAVVGAILLALAEFTTLYQVVIGSLQTVKRSAGTGSNHGYALLFLAVVVLPLALLALRGSRAPTAGSRAAAAGLVAVGAAALVVALAVDLPDTRASGRLPESVAFEDARAQAGPGFYLELLGGLFVLGAGAALLRAKA